MRGDPARGGVGSPRKRVPFSLRDTLFLSVVGFTLVLIAFAISLHQDHEAYSAYCQSAEHAETKGCELDKPFMERLIGDPAAFFTAVLAFLTLVLAAVAVIQIYFLNKSDQTARVTAEAALKSANVAERQVKAAIGAELPVLRVYAPELFQVDKPVPKTGGFGSISQNGPYLAQYSAFASVEIMNQGRTSASVSEILIGWCVGSYPSQPVYRSSVFQTSSFKQERKPRSCWKRSRSSSIRVNAETWWLVSRSEFSAGSNIPISWKRSGS